MAGIQGGKKKKHFLALHTTAKFLLIHVEKKEKLHIFLDWLSKFSRYAMRW